ncbi:MAG: NYN domain-containing protein [Anaerolineales bacterium]|nr:NYN domain-containing protein [Anaerolineales bacterium]
MYYLIDGHNLIPKLPGLALAQMDDEQALIERLQAFCRAGRHQLEVFFDNAPPGQAGQQNFGRVQAHFVRQGRTADDAIRARLQQAGRQARNWAVVSSDRQVQAAARQAGARVLGAEQFASLLSGNQQPGAAASLDEDPDLKLGPDEIEGWLDVFKPRKKP